MAEVHSRGDNHGGEIGGEIVESALQRLQSIGGGEATDAKRSVLSSLIEGKDLQLFASSGKERTALYASWLGGVTGASLVICGTAEHAEAVNALLTEAGIASSVAASSDEVKSGLGGEGVIIGQVAFVGGAFKGSTKPTVARCVVDAVDSIVNAASLADLESSLLSFRDGNPEAQLVLISSEPSLNMSALSRRFHNEPKNCTIKAAGSVEDVEHEYYEVGTTLLAKPQALCDLVELEGGASCIIFCNSPSDADFADVVLRKRGIASLKLIGYVPQIKLSKAIVQFQKKEITALVLTDVAARGVPLEDFDVVINYSIPTDPEVYFHRFGSGPESKTKKVISLVAPLDTANFHYLKKLGKMEFKQGELPTPEQLFVGKFAQLRTEAVETGVSNDPTLSALVEKILADDKSKEIVALLLHNTITVLPSLKSARSESRDEGGDEYEGSEEDFQGGEGRRGGRGRGQRDGRRDGGREARGEPRGDGRGEGRGDGRGEGRGRGDNRRGRQPQHSDVFEDERGGLDEEGGQQPRRGRRGGQDGERGEGRREREPRQPRKPMLVDKEARLYVGAGEKQGISRESLTNDLVNTCGLEASDVHRVSVRGLYSFVDVPEAVATKVLEKLPELAAGGSEANYFVKKAVTLSIPREGSAEESENEVSTESHNGAHHDETDDHAPEGSDDHEGPTLLAVDDV